MYELICIINPLAEKKDPEAAAKIRGFINALDGHIKKEDIWEKRKFAYPIKKHLAGYYAIFQFELEAEKIDELQKQLRLNGDILRSLIINLQEIKTVLLKPVKPKVTAPARLIEDKGEKVKIEELDKKLEEILKE